MTQRIWHIYYLSQSPQTGQVYFNGLISPDKVVNVKSLNPLKRVKFISIYNKSIRYRN